MHPRVVIGLAAALLLTACGQPAVTVSDSELAAAESQIAGVTEVVYGSAAQRSAGERRVYEMFQGGVTDCMADKGFQYDAPGFTDLTMPGSKKTNLTSPWLRRPAESFGAGADARLWVDTMVGRDAGGQSYEALDAEGKSEYDRALDRCQGPDNGYENAQFPEAAWTAIAQLDAIANEVTAAIEDRYGKDYAACMADAGYQVNDFWELYEQVDGAYGPYRDRSLAGKPADAAWQAGVAFEAKAAQADASCRTDAYREAVVMAAPLVQEWADGNADLLASVKQQWQELEQEYGSPTSS